MKINPFEIYKINQVNSLGFAQIISLVSGLLLTKAEIGTFLLERKKEKNLFGPIHTLNIYNVLLA